MPRYAVTAATGQLGRLVVESLLDGGVPAGEVVAVVRTPGKAAVLAERGVEVRFGDYTVADSLPAALADVHVVLLISGSEVGQRFTQHRAVVEAARRAGVGRIVYTSLLRADTTELALAPEHKATEELIRGSGLRFTFLRNGWYTENYTAQLGQYLAHGVIVGATHNAPVAAATRADYAAAAAAVMTGEGHENAVYELGGTPFTMTELAAAVTDATGTPVSYRDVPAAELIEILQAAGLDPGTAQFVAGLDIATARGDLDTASGDLPRLIGRPSTLLVDAVRAAVTAAAG